MEKEIFEQPHVIGNSLSRFLDPINKSINISQLKIDWTKISKINFIACGTSYFACQVACYWFEKMAGSKLFSSFRLRVSIQTHGRKIK